MNRNARHIPRPRLHEALLQADCRLRLLWAPAGYGKSVLLGECLERCPHDTQLARLDLRGQDPGVEGISQRLAAALQLPSSDVDSLSRALAERTEALWLVLDDYPRFAASELDRYLNHLLQHSALSVRWWIASRRRPRLQLTRLLLEGELFELGSAELAFTAEELSQLEASSEQVAKLLALTSGWCAGVRLLLLAQRTNQVNSGECRELLQDYLLREVLDDLPTDWQLALFNLAQFPEFDRELCEQLLGVGEGAALLEQLHECGLFIEPLPQENQTLRIQPAVAAILADQLPESMARALFRKACQWFLSQQQMLPALEYAIKAGQPEVAASLLQQHFVDDRILLGQGIARLLQWRRAVPAELLVGTPRLILLNAWVSLLSGRLDETVPFIQALEALLPQPCASQQRAIIAQYKALAGKLAYHRGQSERAAELISEALEELPEASWGQRLMCQLVQVDQALVAGQFERAREINRQAVKQARERGSLAIECLLALEHACLLGLRGELLRAESLLTRMHTELKKNWGVEPSAMSARLQLLMGALLIQRGRYAEAKVMLDGGTRECHACADPAVVWGHLGLAELQLLQGQADEAFARISDVERLMQYEHIDAQVYAGLILATKARLWLMQGRHTKVERALQRFATEDISAPLFGMPDLHLRLRMMWAQAALLGENRQAAQETLLKLYDQAQAEWRRPLACELGFSLAEAWQAAGQSQQAKQMFMDSLNAARQMGLGNLERTFGQRNLGMFSGVEEDDAEDGAMVLLSQRELEVLQLIARGLSNQQIAEKLFISLHTVKTHAQRINFKLGVERRTQAVAQAKELGLLD